MTIASRVKELALKFGVEAHWYNPQQSQSARLAILLNQHNIELVLDVGANDGGYGRHLRKIGYDKDIISFEPLSDAHKLLIADSNNDDRWHVAPQMAIGEFNGEITINRAGNSTSSSILNMEAQHIDAAPQSRYIGSEQVPIHKLDTFTHPLLLSNSNIFLKIDTQGYEMQVLEGGKNLLNRISGVQIEMSLTPLYQGQKLYLDVIHYLTNLGFELWNVIPGFTDPRTGRMLQMDGVFFK